LQVKEGFSMNVMRAREEQKHPSPPAVKVTSPAFRFSDEVADSRENDADDADVFETLSDNTSKTTAVVQVSGSLDVLVTPLLLESLQR
jgi:hypothetical protein